MNDIFVTYKAYVFAFKGVNSFFLKMQKNTCNSVISSHQQILQPNEGIFPYLITKRGYSQTWYVAKDTKI